MQLEEGGEEEEEEERLYLQLETRERVQTNEEEESFIFDYREEEEGGGCILRSEPRKRVQTNEATSKRRRARPIEETLLPGGTWLAPTKAPCAIGTAAPPGRGEI